MIAIGFASMAVAIIAVASSTIALHRHVAGWGRLAAGLAAAALVPAIFLSIVVAAACGYS